MQKDGKLENNKLIFSNLTVKDIILKDEFEKMLGKIFINTLTDEKTEKYDNRKIDESYLKEKIMECANAENDNYPVDKALSLKIALDAGLA